MSTARIAERPGLCTDSGLEESTLIVVGAGGGMGRWLCSHLFSKQSWRDAILLDANPRAQYSDRCFTCPVRTGVLAYNEGRAYAYDRGSNLIDLSGPAVFCLAVPQSDVALLAVSLLPLLHKKSVVFELSACKSTALETLQGVRPELVVFGVHPLCSPAVSSLDGQTIVICPSSSHPDAHDWLAEMVTANGGLVEIATPEDHDAVMSYVQIAAHQALLSFAEVLTASDHSIDHLWKYRTPLFELLLSLCSRVLDPSQEGTIAAIQLANDGIRISMEFSAVVERLGSLVLNADEQLMRGHVAALRSAFSGTLLTTLQQASNLAVAAVQQTRSELASARRTNALVALERRGRERADGRPVIGRITGLSPTAVSVEDLLIGEKGRSSVLAAPA